MINLREAGDLDDAASACGDAIEFSIWSGYWAEATRQVDLARSLLESDRLGAAGRCHLLAAVSIADGFGGGDYASAVRGLQDAVTIAETLDDSHLLGRILHLKGALHASRGEIPEQAVFEMRAAELLRSEGDLWSAARALYNGGQATAVLGDWTRGEKALDEAIRIADKIGHQETSVLAPVVKLHHEMARTGDLHAGLVRANAAIDRWSSRPSPWTAALHLSRGLCLIEMGDLEGAAAEFQESFRFEQSFLQPIANGCLALALALAGDRDRAAAILAEVESEFLTLRPDSLLSRRLEASLCACALAVMGEVDLLAQMYPVLEEMIGRVREYGYFSEVPSAAVAGLSATAGKRWEEATAHYEAALDACAEAHLRVQEPKVRYWYARMLLDRDQHGDREKARGFLEEAIAQFREIGMPKHLELAEELLGPEAQA